MTAENDELTMTMKRELTGTQEAGYVLVGAFLGIPGVLLSSLCNLNAPYRPDCTKFSCIGLVVWVMLGVIETLMKMPVAVLY